MRRTGRRHVPRRFRRRRYRAYLVAAIAIIAAALLFHRVVGVPVAAHGRVTVERGAPESQLDMSVRDDGGVDVQHVSETGEKRKYRIEQTPEGPAIVDEKEQGH